MAALALEVKDITIAYSGMAVVRELSLEVDPGQAIVILGANGAGKSTLLRAIVGLLPTSGGTVSLFGDDVTKASTAKRARKGLAFMSEQGIFPSLSVKENLQLGAMTNRNRSFDAGLETVLALFPELGGRLNEPAGSLSGGQRKMVGIAKCVIAQPSLLIMDEPSAGLSPKFVSEVVETLITLHSDGMTLLVAEQNVEFLKFAQTAVVLEGGYVRFNGPVAELSNNKTLHDAFFGIESIQEI
ncbi:ABC transporter ATP-binding protein [Ferrimicrobium acidiphilum]|uniref:High-affinity branched-chain amino acid transport ATP-binding protein LivF n=3 Tax=Ferrimicrobium acidiphilum TaxID=121039 RepID=A0A0D8FT04_9ACTN|nr:ABC transporter ATP-binding protein [Ferrimicrobium acidiphilum]KJE75382.1 high-affinity branched-chain amino acid transport ATP-binding protein LivF [Ferrimicrobium acidiphilum DSM 19497]MCL5052953.1 ABC transporter ATP-binding protein [Gammaproteobacteria bacterium]